ncbi:mCG142516, isoform CRA_b [Mus musculus]|nr:mCG142516, isoform CRA_b [Mus musculus]
MEKEGGSASSFNSFCPVRSDPAWADERLRSLHVQCFLPANQTATRQHPDLAWSPRVQACSPKSENLCSWYTQKRSQATDILQKKALNSEIEPRNCTFLKIRLRESG